MTVCESQLPFYYEEDQNQIPLYAGDHLFHLQDSHGCDSIVVVQLSVSNYYIPPTQTEFVCYDDEPSFYWDVNGQTYHTSGLHVDTIPYSDCEGIFSLDLNFQQTPERIVLDTVVCDEFIWQVTGLPYGQTDTYYHSVSLSPYPCYQEYQLNLIVNKKDLNGEPEHPEDFDGQCDSIQFGWFGNTTYFKENGDYLFSSEPNPNAFFVDLDAQTHTMSGPGCDTATMVRVTNMKYTPKPNLFGPEDDNTIWFGLPDDDDPTNDTAMCAAVVTNTEFFSFQYTFYVRETGNSVWENCEWAISKPSWIYNPVFDTVGGKWSTCTVYVADRDENLVVLTATAKNSCNEKTKKFYLKSSFLNVDENGYAPVNVDIVPNPNNGQMHLNFENMQGRTVVKVFDMTGNQIDAFETNINSSRYNYDYNMKKYAEGIYFFVVSNNNRVLTKKVIVIQ